ncbi:hypothetical protein HSX37_10760|uniref:DUF4309 domain-containing protein n=1 Tax=Dendrosporobacter quercicolus TaxID=146817 RepID=A0A1G9T5Q3_9FIRM|nr:hypothetical protein [Dendrosporobacter quercicolus]NSL48511.1 hypothetical protein [Dendrosporobacter quercicolus DSM 1736]SDM42966.1 hypothetical protein SAMN04488502_104220 [Dendrosporobacter quercicolus]
MRTKVVFLLIVLLLCNAAAVSAAISAVDLAVNEIRPAASSYADVIAKFGYSKKQIVDTKHQPPVTYLIYSGLRIGLSGQEGPVAVLQLDTGQYQTSRGVKIGATAYKVIKEYGQPDQQIINGHRYFIYQLESAPEQRLIFDMSEGYVTKIIMTSLTDIP